MNELTKYEDNELLVLMRDKEPLCQHAFEVLWYRYSNRLRQYCLLKTGNREESEDLFQNTWIEFYKSKRKRIKITSLKNYLLSTAYFLNCQKLKSNKINYQNTDPFVIDRFIDDSSNFEEHFENQDLLLKFYLSINILDEPSKECLILRWNSELTYQEIATILNDTPEAVRKRCCRAMDEISTYLDSINLG